MKLTRTIHVGGVQVFFDAAGVLVPDVQLVTPGEPGADVADLCLMFVDTSAGEADGYLFTAEQARELAAKITRPTLEVVRTFPGSLLGPNGDAGV